MKVFQFPLTKITLGFVIGIIIQYQLHCTISLVFFAFLTAFLGLIIFYFFLNFRKVNSIYFGLMVLVFSITLGVFTQITRTDFFQKNNYIYTKDLFGKPHLFSICIREQLRSSAYGDRYIAVIQQVDSVQKTGRILLNVKNDSLNSKFEMGTVLQIHGMLNKNISAKNPFQFDYSKYLINKEIYAKIDVDITKIQSKSVKKDIWYYAARVRTNIIQNLEKSGFNKTELNVLIALFLGQQQEISPEIVRDYQFAGAVHILSVSGLHVGFILIFITQILKPIPNTRKGSFLKLLITLFSLFLFGFIAGLAPSVLRSVTMFSFVAIGMYLRQSTNIYHTLMVSVLLILLIQPYFLFDVGFQLSYLAIFFIVWLQPVFLKAWNPKNRVIKYFWDILTVSFAAQIGTLPLSIYYFHQFPGLFFITNLIIIPFLTLIMIFGVVVMVLAAVDYLPIELSKILEGSIYFLNKIINYIASFEQFIFKDIPCNFQLLLGWYLLIFTIIFWFKKNSFNRLILVLFSVVVLQILFLINNLTLYKQSEMIVFNSKRSSMISVRKGKGVMVYSSDSLTLNNPKNKVLSDYLTGNFSLLVSKQKLNNIMYFKKNKILIVDSCGIYDNQNLPDVVLLTQSSKINLERLLQNLMPKKVIADASNFNSMLPLWNHTCKKYNIPFHATAENGFVKF